MKGAIISLLFRLRPDIVKVPPLPGSPGGRRGHRPAMRPRMNTSSPTIHGTVTNMPGGGGPVVLLPRPRSRVNSDASNHAPPTATTPTAPDPEDATQKVPTPPPVRINSPPTKPFKKEKKQPTQSASGDSAVPPIKVLIVEDNVINLRLLEAFMRRLKVRWESAMNGKIAVDKWKAGGFHLILMDIQLPVMNGLDATKEIRRLERVNNIGSFPHTKLLEDKTEESEEQEQLKDEDKLPDSILFRSPVIIVALTASSLQSDRHEAYAAGCNDFLTKPVNFIWLEKKVTEWGCMQALIDFDGWRKWKIIANEQSNSSNDNKGPKSKRQPRMLKERASAISAAG